MNTEIIPDREHIVQLNNEELIKLRKWLEFPNGGFHLKCVTFEAVENGGLLVRTQPYSYPHIT